jgi:hypothetical protein
MEARAMTKANRWRPQLEALEDRFPPTNLFLGVPGHLASVGQRGRQHSHHLTLKGQVSGVWSASQVVPDAGSDQSLTGSGSVQPLGAVGASADLQLPGFVALGQAQGRLTLANTHGSITLALVGPPQQGFGGPPASLTYTITGGTGKYAGASGAGRAALQEAPARPACPPGTIVCTRLALAPRFTLTF